MKTTKLWAAVLLAGGILTANAQTNLATTTITSRGLEAGNTGTENTFFGYQAGKTVSPYNSGTKNTFVGHLSGRGTLGGYSNTFLGYKAGEIHMDGWENVFLGSMAGSGSSDNARNVFVGFSSGLNSNGNDNVFIGYKSGFSNDNYGNIFLGKESGYNELGSNKLYIENSNSSTPLIWGDFAADQLKLNGKVGIGMGTTAFPNTAGGINVSTYKLIVNGGILATEVRVATTWADYVFEDTYTLPSLTEVECFIEENGHLPNVPSAKEIEQDGISVGEMAKIQQEKIEELTLYAIEQNKKLEKQEKEIGELKQMVQSLMKENK